MDKTIISMILFLLITVSLASAINYNYLYNPYTGRPDRSLSDNQSGVNMTFGNVSMDCIILTNGQPMCWNSDYYTLDVPTGLGNTIQIGQELTGISKNKEGKDIYAGQIVYQSGSQGEIPTVRLANASNGNHINNLAMVTIPVCNNNAACPVTTFGYVNDLDTSAFSEGDIIYLKDDGSGNYTNIPIEPPGYNLRLGRVIRSHKSTGIILFLPGIDVGDGVVLNELDVLTNLTVDTNTLFVDSVNHKVGIGTVTPSEKLDVNGNISVDDTIIMDNFNTNSVLFIGDNNEIKENSAFAYNYSNNKFSVFNGSISTEPNFVEREIYSKLEDTVYNSFSGMKNIFYANGDAFGTCISGDEVEFTSGANSGEIKTISSIINNFDGTHDLIVLTASLSNTPSSGDAYKVEGVSEFLHPFEVLISTKPKGVYYKDYLDVVNCYDNVVPSILPDGELEPNKYGIVWTSGSNVGKINSIISTSNDAYFGSYDRLYLGINGEVSDFSEFTDTFDIVLMEDILSMKTYNLNVEGFVNFDNEIKSDIVTTNYIFNRPEFEMGKGTFLSEGDASTVVTITNFINNTPTNNQQALFVNTNVFSDETFKSLTSGINTQLTTSSSTNFAKLPSLYGMRVYNSFYSSPNASSNETYFFIADFQNESASNMSHSELGGYAVKGLHNYIDSVDKRPFYSDGGESLLKAGSGEFTPLTLRAYTGQTANLFEIQDDIGDGLIVINGSGYVGIGTNTPNKLLEVNGNNAGIRIDATGATDPLLQFYSDGAAEWTMGMDENSGDSFNIDIGSQVTSGAEFLIQSDGDVIVGQGNLGVGTYTPTSKLHVDGNLNVTGNITGNQIYGGMFYHNHTGALLNFAVQDTWYPLYFTNATDLNGFTYEGGVGLHSNLTALMSGKYQASYMGIGSGQNNHVYLTSILVDDIEKPECGNHHKMAAGGDVITQSGVCIISINAGQKVSVATQDMGGTGNGYYYGGNINLVRIGDLT